MNQQTIRKLERHYSERPIARGQPASAAAIEEAEQRLGCRLHPDYIEFLRLFGCGFVGPDPVYGLGPGRPAGIEQSVVEQTEWFRSQRWPGIDGWYVISDDERGNPIGIASDGKVRLSDHDVGDTPVVAESFEEFLLQRL